MIVLVLFFVVYEVRGGGSCGAQSVRLPGVSEKIVEFKWELWMVVVVA